MTQTYQPASIDLCPDLLQGAVLVLDAAGRACQAAVYVDGKCRAHRSPEMTYGQAEWLIPLVRDVAAEAGIALDDLAAVITTVGPGSFTGLRVGLAAAQGFGVAAKCPVVGVTSLAAWAMAELAMAPTPESGLRVVLDSRRDDAFVQDFDNQGRAITPPGVLALDQAKETAGAMRLVGDLVSQTPAPHLTGIFAAALCAGHQMPPHPIYLRDADAVPMAKPPMFTAKPSISMAKPPVTS